VTLRFGKHQGASIEQVPTAYLHWLERQGWIFPDLRAAVAHELARRRQQRMFVSPGLALPPEIAAAARELVSAGYRALAREHHPDAGGDHGGMVRINLAHEALRALVA
jgi:putative quorum-sensing-regulated virulence factor